ncbi:17760_t:CDS:1, partial [Gigaspora margarita]
SRSTSSRHLVKQKNTWPNSANIPAQQRKLVTSISQISSSATPVITSYTSQGELNNEHNQILGSEKEFE